MSEDEASLWLTELAAHQALSLHIAQETSLHSQDTAGVGPGLRPESNYIPSVRAQLCTGITRRVAAGTMTMEEQ